MRGGYSIWIFVLFFQYAFATTYQFFKGLNELAVHIWAICRIISARTPYLHSGVEVNPLSFILV